MTSCEFTRRLRNTPRRVLLLDNARWRSWLRFLSVVTMVTGMGMGCNDASLTMDNREAFFEAHRSALTTLDAALERSRVHTLSARSRSTVEINDHVMRSLASASMARAWVDSVLRLDSIPRAAFDSLQDLLEEAQVRYVMQELTFTIYVVGGALDNVNGFLRIRSGAGPPRIDTEIDRARLRVLSPVAQRWYYFGTS